MKKVVRQVALLALILALACVLGRLTMHNTYVDIIPLQGREGEARELRFVEGEARVLNHDAPGVRDGYVRVAIQPQIAGEALYALKDSEGRTLSTQRYRVSRFMTVYDYDTGGFTGDSLVMLALTAFWLGTTIIMARAFLAAKGPGFYAYDTIYYVGFGLFSLVTAVTMLILTLRHFTDPLNFSMFDTYAALSGAGVQFMVATLPLMAVFAVAMAISNIALLCHERARLKNVLGLIVSALLLAGAGLGLYLLTRQMSGSFESIRLTTTMQNVYGAAFSYFECMLAGAAVCGILAARHVPPTDRDFIVILGCWFRRDGTLTPLLKGRVDRALEFWKAQRAATGREAVLVPSGGQGPDEPMPEAQAMRRYLLEQGVPERLIMTEERSANTFQNMAFSKAMMDAAAPGGRVAFATTNYHVFRSGVWAARAGLSAEGMGSNTRWWYWPNAFMRECAGLLVNRWRQEVLLLVGTTAFFGLLSMLLMN